MAMYIGNGQVVHASSAKTGIKISNYTYRTELVLKFDIDDLFYYASHKIMKRGGHYFVADFGMQVNILNRYGIKNYAVCGRDYSFKNGDSTDFRRENLIIHNKYHGVLIVPGKTGPLYRARIHVKGNFIIGTYRTIELKKPDTK